MNINAANMHFKDLNEQIKQSSSDVIIEDCMGQRFIGSGQSGKNITINGIPGNALGSYLDGGTIVINGNVQDAVGDTMNDGLIIIKGNAGDALGYAMRGGKIYVKGNSGYRTGIHMKQFKDKNPVIIIGGSSGSFLGEYLAGGIIIVLGLNNDQPIVGNFTGTGIHGGKIFIRTDCEPLNLPKQVSACVATDEDLSEIYAYLKEYANIFSLDLNNIMSTAFYVLRPNATNPYKRLYTTN